MSLIKCDTNDSDPTLAKWNETFRTCGKQFAPEKFCCALFFTSIARFETVKD